MESKLDYAAAVRVLQNALLEVAANARGFALRAQGKPTRLSARNWHELAEIEAFLSYQLEQNLRREMKATPWSPFRQMRAMFQGYWIGFGDEEARIRRAHQLVVASPVERWRAGAPQLEASLWPFFQDRTHYLANTFSLALNEPAPFPTLIWRPDRRAFQGRTP